MAKISLKSLREKKRTEYVEKLFNYLESIGEDVGYEKSNILNFPIVLEDGSEDAIKIQVSIPTGAEKGTEPYDCYGTREEYQIKLKEKAEKAEKAKKAKAEKIAKDKLRRENEKKIKERNEARAE